MLMFSKPDPKTYLMHYGVKGMKWGVRRTPEELRYNRGSIVSIVNQKTIDVETASGHHVANMSSHAGDQAEERKVSAKEIIDALQKPMYIRPTKYDKEGRPSNQYVGEKATVCVNPETGVLTSLWKTNKKLRAKYQKGDK